MENKLNSSKLNEINSNSEEESNIISNYSFNEQSESNNKSPNSSSNEQIDENIVENENKNLKTFSNNSSIEINEINSINSTSNHQIVKKKYDPYSVSRSSLKMKRKRNEIISPPTHSSTILTSLPTIDSNKVQLTDAEREFERKRRKIEEERLKEGASNSYREKIHKFNEKASKSIDFHEMPRV